MNLKESEEGGKHRKIWKKKGKGEILELHYNFIKNELKFFKGIYWMIPTLLYNNDNVFSGATATPQKVIDTVQDNHIEKK